MITAKRKRDDIKHRRKRAFKEAEARKVRGREWSFMVIEVVTGLKSLFHLRPGYRLMLLCVCVCVCVCVKPQC